jgi:hypothetical protein
LEAKLRKQIDFNSREENQPQIHKNNLGRLVSIIGVNWLGRLVSKNVLKILVSQDGLTYTVESPDKLVSWRLKIILRD